MQWWNKSADTAHKFLRDLCGLWISRNYGRVTTTNFEIPAEMSRRAARLLQAPPTHKLPVQAPPCKMYKRDLIVSIWPLVKPWATRLNSLAWDLGSWSWLDWSRSCSMRAAIMSFLLTAVLVLSGTVVKGLSSNFTCQEVMSDGQSCKLAS